MTAALTPFEYELLADRDTVAGDAAWRDGRYSRAVALWLSAARWARAAEVAKGGATL